MYATAYARMDRAVIRRPRAARVAAERARRLAIRAAVFLGVLVVLALVLAQTAHGSGPSGYSEVTVGPGDTVWSIAVQRYPGEDTRQRVADIMAANGLEQPVIRPGQHLRVPNRG